MANESKKVKITQVKSVIGTIQAHRATIRTLGLGKRNDVVERELTPSVQGMIRHVAFLLKVEEIK
ncbi:MAG: 50S ribosomal protein L30 [Candidatus Sumerlaeota bacterium]